MDTDDKINRLQNPRETANVLSLVTFYYTKPLFIQGFKKDLEDDDIYDVISPCQAKKCGDKLEHAYHSEGKKKNPSTRRIIWNVYGLRYIGLGLLHLTWKLVNSVMEPETISKLVAYFKPGQKTMTFNDAIYYASIMIGLKLLHCFYFQNYIIYLSQLAIQIRTAFCSIIYRKSLKMSPRALARISLGNIVTVITKDVLQFESSIWLFNDLWIAIVETLVACYLIYNKIGLSSLIGVGILLSYIPMQVFVGRWVKNMRLKINKRTDNRLQMTQETISTIKIIKMYTWEMIFGDRIHETRRKEMNAMMKTAYAKISLMASSILVSKLSFYALVMAYIWLNTDVSAETMFYVMRCFGTLRLTIAMQFSMGFTRIAELLASLQRIDIILGEEEISEHLEKPDDEPQIEFRDISLNLKNKDILRNISLKFQTGLTVLTGQLGCGKSSLIKIALRDYPIDTGELRTRGRHSYASQDPWLFPATIKQNILFGEKFHHDRYQKVIDVCALQYDLSILEKGDDTVIADRGLNLSKGQQARVNLARAVYKDADIYFIDDALTALDPRVQEQIFNKCIKGFLKDKLVVLVTHNPQHIEKAEKVIILEGGMVKFQGKQQELSKDILEAIEDEVHQDEKEEPSDEETDEKTDLIKKPPTARKAIYHEVKKEGGVSLENYAKYLNAGGGILLFLAIIVIFFICTFTESGSQKILTNWINERQILINLHEEIQNSENSSTILNQTLHTSITTSLPTSLETAILENSTLNISPYLGESVTTPIPHNTSTKNISNEYIQLEMQAAKTLNMYSIMTFGSTFLELLKHYLILKFAISASVRIHKMMIDGVVYSTMSFFDTFFLGNILNRFSQDLSAIDERIPFMFSHFLSTLFALGGMIGLIVTIDWRFLISSGCVIVISVILRALYIPTGRSLKRLEAATRSPLVGHLNSTIEGMTTIRAFKAQDILRNEFDKHQDVFTSANYTSLCLRRAFSFYMDFVSVAFITYVVLKFLLGPDNANSGDVGLTITQVSGVAMIVQHVLTLWAEVENQMTSVERVVEYSKLEPEKTDGSKVEHWPSKGEISYKNVSLTYTNSHEKVLKNISFSVESKQKIGIVGRTGAGKSSIISTLFRLYEYEGEIIIDGVEIKALDLKFLRNHISIIPQDPIMFSGTVRSNVDPLNEYSDEDIWKTLHKIHLDTIVPNLDTNIEDINFSTGQRQLICVARAIIKKNRIVVLDEATANMDPETEDMVQKIINDNFSSCTVFIIAHRLQSILDCDKVMVLDLGQIVEFDNPRVLIENPKSLFSQMLKNAGIDESDESNETETKKSLK